ncbi:hypothetical protein CQA66_07495 [Helicobacter aurati]|uniref:Campylobacter invasion antigen D C-terminal domain-containing protein n=1 Tax=Helicobacter aurati TaxID=137778 RepID=A0A3D8J268_9HELI|nr:hypothetical protein [Helicobacter aurati]RDU70851.1 hypothetical protein CQA66_07495 [Helicobacter aurati]
MELKDVVLQTLNEIENGVDEKGFKDITFGVNTGEIEFLQSFKERLFVLFEGLRQDELWTEEAQDSQSKAESKLELILGFLQFQLALIDARLDSINRQMMDAEEGNSNLGYS